MKVARLHGIGDIRVGEEPDPVPGAGQSLVRVTAIGLCGSDLHWYGEGGIGDAQLSAPLVVGHEFAGVVESGPLKGRRVAVDPAIPCHVCELCREGHPNLCLDIGFAGHGVTDGGLRELLVWPSSRLHPLPDNLSDADGAMLEPLGVAVHSLDLGHVRLGDTVAVIGCGPIGLLLIRLARLAGAATVVASDPLPQRREAATRYGADAVFDPASGADVNEFLREAVGVGANVVFEVAGSNDAVATSMLAARPGGRVVLVGIPDPDEIAFPASTARRKGLTIALVRRMKEVYPRAIALVEKGQVDVSSLVSDRYTLDEVAEAFKSATARRGLKTVVEP
ncbi:zinc-binding dehydrogenase [Phytomonospora sp. NPDC050363]|uniref:zinc-dependent alcohol dehydrogenase n=1 Tax=Phytomonospora sp. NPDC050363 TaxID=3155642 RepID=UPI00340330AA